MATCPGAQAWRHSGVAVARRSVEPIPQASRNALGPPAARRLPADWMAAMRKSLLWDEKIPIGKFFERTGRPDLHESEPVLNAAPLAHANTRIPVEVTRAFIEELM